MNRFNLSALAVKERAITLFLLIAIAAAGLLAFSKLGRAEDPTFVVKIMTVTAVWPGATAEEMQNQVADRLEKRLQELEHYDRTETSSRPGLVTMKVYLKDNTPPKEVPDEFYQVRKKLADEARFLPRGVLGPIFNDEYTDVYFSLYALKAADLPHRDLVQDAERLRQRLTRVPGVQKVKIMGEQNQKIFVEISYQRLATLGLSAQALFSAIAHHNDVTPSGFVEADGPRVYLRVDGAITDIESVRSIPLPVPGRTLTVGDVAEVRKGYEDPPTFQIRESGEPALILGVVMQKRYNGLTLGKDLADEVSRLRAELPMGITLTQISDQGSVIKAAINEFMVKFFTALAVVILVSLLTLGFRVGIVVAAAVPLTLGAVFMVMLVTGRDFDRITLGALILSLGLLVDDAIIAIETMVVKMEEGWDRVKAAGYAWTSTAAPMLTGTLVTIVGFLPVGFALSTAGEYAGNIFWIVAFSLLVSWFVAVIFTPYMGVKLLPNIAPKSGGHHSIYHTKNYERFRRLIRACVDHKWLTAGVTVLYTLDESTCKGCGPAMGDHPIIWTRTGAEGGRFFHSGIGHTTNVFLKTEVTKSLYAQAILWAAGASGPSAVLDAAPRVHYWNGTILRILPTTGFGAIGAWSARGVHNPVGDDPRDGRVRVVTVNGVILESSVPPIHP